MANILTSQDVDDLRMFAASFVAPEAKKRFDALLQTKRGRTKLLEELDHFRWLDSRFMVPLPPNKQTIDDIEYMLVGLGASESCRIISTSARLNGKTLPLRDALVEVVASGSGTIMLCVPGQLAYYEGESPLERHICYRRSAGE